jgi:hypothetical protein
MTDQKNREVLILPSEMGNCRRLSRGALLSGGEGEERRLGVDAQGGKEAVAAIYGVERGGGVVWAKDGGGLVGKRGTDSSWREASVHSSAGSQRQEEWNVEDF